MKRFLIFFGVFAVFSPLFAVETVWITDPKTGKQAEVAKDRILVKYKDNISQTRKLALRGSSSFGTIKAIPDLNIDVLRVDSSSLVSSLIHFQSQSEVEFAEPDYVLQFYASRPNDTYASLQYGNDKISLYDAWDKLSGARTVKVADIDDGFDYNHEDFGGGFRCSTCTFYDGYDFGDNDSDPIGSAPVSAHGTQVCGIIAAISNNNQGVAGVSHGLVQILGVKVSDDATGTLLNSNVALGINYAVSQGVQVINLSLGSAFPSSSEKAAIDRALAANITVVAAAGNSGNSVPVSYPAAFPGVIAVGASDSNDAVTSFSQSGPEIALVAPGKATYTTYPGNTYQDPDGTSFASPYTAGVAALILSIRPSLTPSQVKSILTNSADDLYGAGFDTLSGYGRLNASRALSTLPRGEPPEDISVPTPNPFVVGVGGRVTFRVPAQLGGTAVASKVFSSGGHLIRTLSGNEWDGKNDEGNTVASGVYFYELETTAGKSRNKVFLVR